MTAVTTVAAVHKFICLFCRSNLSKHQKMWPPKRVVCWNLGVLGHFLFEISHPRRVTRCALGVWNWPRLILAFSLAQVRKICH